MERGGPQELTRVCGLNTENKASGAAVAKGSDEGGGGGDDGQRPESGFRRMRKAGHRRAAGRLQLILQHAGNLLLKVDLRCSHHTHTHTPQNLMPNRIKANHRTEEITAIYTTN